MHPLYLRAEVRVTGPLQRTNPRITRRLVIGTQLVGSGALALEGYCEGGVVASTGVDGAALQNNQT